MCYWCCYKLLFMRVYMWLRDRDWWWWCSEKKEKTSFFSLLSRSFSIVFDWCDIWRRRPISLFFFLSVGFYLLAKCILDELWFDEERERDKIITYTIGTSEAARLHQNKTTDERDEEEEEGGEGTSGEIIFCFHYCHHIKNNTRWMEWIVKTKRIRETHTKRRRVMEKMKQDVENEEEATTVCQDLSDLFSASLSFHLPIGSRNHLLTEREERTREPEKETE